MRPDVFQICGGRAAISPECAEQGLFVANVADKVYGWDLKGAQHMAMVKRYITYAAPRFVTVQLPAMSFSSGSPHNQRKESFFLDLAEFVFDMQLGRQSHTYTEN